MIKLDPTLKVKRNGKEDYRDTNECYFNIEDNIFEYYISAHTLKENETLGIEGITQESYLFEHIHFKKDDICNIMAYNFEEPENTYGIYIQLKSGYEVKLRYNDFNDMHKDHAIILNWWLK